MMSLGCLFDSQWYGTANNCDHWKRLIIVYEILETPGKKQKLEYL